MGGCALSGGARQPEEGEAQRGGGAEQGGGAQVVVDLNEARRRVIKESWRALQEDVAKVGVILFVKLFETHPECRDVFLEFRDEEDLEKLKASRELRAHGLRIMSFVEKTVARIDHTERLDQLILDLGRKHFRYHAPPKYYAFMGAEFIRAIRPLLKERWSPEVEDAWQTLFQYIFCMMKRGFLEEETNQRS